MIFTPRHRSLLSYQTAKFHQLWYYHLTFIVVLKRDTTIVRWYASAYHLLYLYESLFIYLFYYCRNFVARLSQKQTVQSSSYFLSIFGLIWNREPPLFSLITQPWRQLHAILCFHLIMNIFITMTHKLPKFCTHKLQMISQHTDNPCPRARHDAHVRARQNLEMLKITYKQFCVRTMSSRAFQNFPSVRIRARVVRARSANQWQKFKIMAWFGFLIRQLTISICLQSLLTFHKAVRARQSSKSARAAMGNIMQKFAKTCYFWNQNSARTNRTI